MKLKIALCVIILAITVNMGVSAQGQPVIDVTAIIAAIENGYTMVQQLQTMYETLRTSYDQLQKQMKSFESYDLNALNANDPLGSWKAMTTYANRMSTYEQNIESIINKKDIKIGNGTYSLNDIFIAPIADRIDFSVFDPLEKMLTPEERMIFLRKFGQSFGNNMRIAQMREMLQKKASEVIAYSGNLQKNLAEDRERLSAITSDMFDNQSIIQQQQINNAVLSIMAQDIKTQSSLLGDIAAQFATAAAQAQAEKQALQEELNINRLGVTEGFLKMLEDMAPMSDYR
jgi:hypothetical protein